jgi:hypothetical protein
MMEFELLRSFVAVADCGGPFTQREARWDRLERPALS